MAAAEEPRAPNLTVQTENLSDRTKTAVGPLTIEIRSPRTPKTPKFKLESQVPDSPSFSLDLCENAKTNFQISDILEKDMSQFPTSPAMKPLLGSPLKNRSFTSDEYDASVASGELQYLKKCEQLHIPTIPKLLKTFQTAATELKLDHYGIGKTGVIALASALKVNQILETISLADNCFYTPGIEALAASLSSNSTLKSLNISENSAGNLGGIAVAKILTHVSEIIELNLSRNELKHQAAYALSSALFSNRKVQKLDMSHNDIGANGGIAFAKMLHENSTLVELDLSWNSVLDKGGCALADSLCANSGVLNLNMSWNGMGIAAGISWAKVVRDNAYLETLNLDNNRFDGTETGDSELTSSWVEAIESNSTLQSISLSGNPLGTMAAFRIKHALDAKPKLTFVGFNRMDQYLQQAEILLKNDSEYVEKDRQ